MHLIYFCCDFNATSTTATAIAEVNLCTRTLMIDDKYFGLIETQSQQQQQQYQLKRNNNVINSSSTNMHSLLTE